MLITQGAAGALAAPSLSWSASTLGASASAISCTSEALCEAVGREGDVFTSSDPGSASPRWSAQAIDAGEAPLTGISCAPEGPCVAVDSHGNVFTERVLGSPSWPHTNLEGADLTGISCASAALCVAVDSKGRIWTSTNPASEDWHATSFGEARKWTAVSCAPGSSSSSSPKPCVALDSAGELASSTEPTSGSASWRVQRIDLSEPLAVSCASASLCVAVDAAGQTLSSGDPASAAPSWVITKIDGARPGGISCAPSGLCVVVDEAGNWLASDDAGASIPSWSAPTNIDAGNELDGAACLSAGLCVAVDAAGHAFSGRVGAPVATTLAPTETTSSTATLAGLAEANDAQLSGCRFEYGPVGTSGTYDQSVPCATLPTAISGREPVAAEVSGLLPNTTYDYRLVLTSAAGVSGGANVTFATAASSQVALVAPHPSIGGTPAVGQHLTCSPGTPAGVQLQLAYQWVRDQIPIPSATSSSYTVKGQDSGHHLQCQVTATDGGGSLTALSSFVTIPAGGAPASAGETSVGGATFRAARLSVPVNCSASAAGGCEITVRLNAVETLSGHRVVAVAARLPNAKHGHTAALRHTTVTLASTRVHLSAGVHATVTAALSKSAKRLLAALHHFTASATVTGTVIGAIEAQLSQQQLTLSASSSHAAKRASRRR